MTLSVDSARRHAVLPLVADSGCSSTARYSELHGWGERVTLLPWSGLPGVATLVSMLRRALIDVHCAMTVHDVNSGVPPSSALTVTRVLPRCCRPRPRSSIYVQADRFPKLLMRSPMPVPVVLVGISVAVVE